MSNWIKHGGGPRPVPDAALVEIRMRGGVTNAGVADIFNWHHVDGCGDIVAYRHLYAEPDVMAEHLRSLGYTVEKPLTFDDVQPLTEAPDNKAYWFIWPDVADGVVCRSWDGDEHDLLILRRRLAYATREHALIAARHIFELKGGVL